MMQEVSEDTDSVTQALGQTTIADELRDAAQTAVTQAAATTSVSTASIPPPPPPAMSQSPMMPASPPQGSASPLPSTSGAGAGAGSVPPGPPTTGFVPKPGVATPAHYPTPSAHQGTPSPTPFGAMGTPPPPTQTSSPPQRYFSPSNVPTAGMQSPQSVYNPAMSPPSQSIPSMRQGSPALPSYHQTTDSPILPPIARTVESQGGGGSAATATAVDLGGDSLGPVYPTHHEHNQGIMGWFSGGGGGFMNKVMEKTKAISENIVTTLDPGMKEVIFSGGDVSVVVASEKEVKVGAVRQAFQEVFGRATVDGLDSQPSIAPQPVGYTAGLKGCEERIEQLRRSPKVHELQTLVAVESFIVEVFPDKWFDIACLLLKDTTNNIELQTFSQATPLDSGNVQLAQDQTPSDYPLRWSGLSVTIGQVISRQLGPHVNHADWHAHVCGISRRDMIYSSAKALATMYKHRLPPLQN